jgi:vacuolar-type H+-ATPase subunit H
MVNYSNGKIYTIRSFKTDLIYVGSTTQSLSVRLGGHKRDYKHFLNKKCNYVSSFEIFEIDDSPYIELVFNCPCKSKDELEREEGKYIREITCVNKKVSGRTRKEYREENKEVLKEKFKKYREDNKELIKEKKKKYYEENKEVLKENNKKYYEDNKELIKEKKKTKVKCPHCNKDLNKSSLNRHIKRQHI